MKADDLKPLAAAWLRTRFPDAHIAYELSLAEYGGAQIDVGAICPDQIVGVEIKAVCNLSKGAKTVDEWEGRVCH